MTLRRENGPAQPLRLRMAGAPGRNSLDGGWWPRSREPAVELRDLVDHFPLLLGHIVAASVSVRDWDTAPQSIRSPRGPVPIDSLPHDQRHLVVLRTSVHDMLRVLVVPPHFTRGQGEEALLAAATHGNAHSAGALLVEVTDHPDVDPRDLWTDKGVGPR